MIYQIPPKDRLPIDVRRYYEGPLWSSAHLIPELVTEDVSQGWKTPYVKLFAGPQGPAGGAYEGPFSLPGQPAYIPSAMAFIVHAVEWEVYYTHTSDLREACRGVYLMWSFDKGKKGVSEIEMMGLGQSYGEDQNTSIPFEGLYRGTLYYRHLPVLIPANTSFQVRLYTPHGMVLKDTVHLRLSLLGMATGSIPE